MTAREWAEKDRLASIGEPLLTRAEYLQRRRPEPCAWWIWFWCFVACAVVIDGYRYIADDQWESPALTYFVLGFSGLVAMAMSCRCQF